MVLRMQSSMVHSTNWKASSDSFQMRLFSENNR